MREYPKIETLFERQPNFIVTDVLKRPIFGEISKWVVTEKVDGTNIRVKCTKGANVVEIGGRTANAQIPADLVKYLFDTFHADKIANLFDEESDPETSITLFGEGYGAGIQKGAAYGPTKRFILFDALVEVGPNSRGWWMDDAAVTKFAEKLGIPRVPILGTMSLPEIVTLVKNGFRSVVAEQPMIAEGVVARPTEPLFDRRGERMILKLKLRDYTGGK